MTVKYGPKIPGRPTIKHEAWFEPATQTVGLYRNIQGGICGPAGEGKASTLAEAAEWLFTRGFLVSGPWVRSSKYQPEENVSCYELTAMDGQED